jgi:LacI family transcriptional regulator
MKSDNITISDIAKALNLSNGTISKALKDHYTISEPVRKKVQEYARQHNYRPNLAAQALRGNKSRSIALLLPSIPNSFFAEVISGIESVIHDRNYHLIIAQSLESFEKEQQNLKQLSWHAIDGLVVSLSTETTDLSPFRELQQKGLPIVFFDRVPDNISTHLVTADNEEGAFQLTSHLIAQGYHKIAHITSPAHTSITRERLSGYYKALQKARIPIEPAFVQHCEHGGKELVEIETAVNNLLALKNKPDAIITASDRITIGCFSILKKKKIRIPGQMALAGFCNFSAPELFEPALTTLHQPAFEMGKTATELLISLIESKKAVTDFKHIRLPVSLQIRQSTAKKK